MTTLSKEHWPNLCETDVFQALLKKTNASDEISEVWAVGNEQYLH